ncbi:MAG: stage IV sporulation protein A [Eubacteriales bacterium]
MKNADEYLVYKDIKERTGGEIYIGVVGPVRTGKSTFIKRFMDLMVLPLIEDEYDRSRAIDELPQSSGGRTITTTEPKFVPKEAVSIGFNDELTMKIRLVDCVGYMVPSASGHMENQVERMVQTPWDVAPIPFTKAAEVGTRKVIQEHATIGIVVTTDGSFGDIDVEQYAEAQERTIVELQQLHKPFVVLLNTIRPYSNETIAYAKELSEKYEVTVIPMNIEQMKQEDILMMMEEVLYEFPISMIEFYMPKWIDLLPDDHCMKVALIERVQKEMSRITTIRHIMEQPMDLTCEYVKKYKVEEVNMATGCIRIDVTIHEIYYYQLMSQVIGTPIENEYQLMNQMRKMSKMKEEYGKVLQAMESVRQKGYGVVTPYRDEITLEKPEVIKHGNKYGVKIKAESPSIHMIKATIETEIAPIVGTEEQAKDLIGFIMDADSSEEGIWETNIFGKSVEQLVNDGITSKIDMIGEESQIKLQETMQKIVNDSNGGIVCIII